MKTNKSFSKRLRLTRRGKVLSRRGGQNHFNAKESRKNQLSQKRWVNFKLSNKDLGRFIPAAR